ncbi:MAG: PH domain-containing protein [Candidatus Komeilibacteria bacterium]|nr:PH domain-containing protein [Candidatus Komeilibacteria bacterium]
MQNTYRPFALAHFWQWLGASAVFLTPFFFLYLLLRWGTIGLAILSLLFIIGSGWLLRAYRLWHQGVLVLEDDKIIIINQLGFFDRTVSQIQLDKINDISFRKKGFWQTIGNFGTIAIQVSASPEKLLIHNLRQPELVQRELYAAQEEYASRDVQEYSEAELLGVIREIRSRIGEPRWKQIQKGNWKLKQDLIDEVGEMDKEKAEAMKQFFSRKI